MQVVTFRPGDGRQCVNITIIEDATVEGPETFPVTIARTPGIIAGPDTTVTIRDVGSEFMSPLHANNSLQSFHAAKYSDHCWV